VGRDVVFPELETERKSLTKKERLAMLVAQDFKCATPDCKGKPEIAEHTTPVAMGNTEKPDCLLCRRCALEKTKGDVAMIAAGHRKAGRTGQYARRKRRGGTKIPARVNPWPKRKFPKRKPD
jgi:hypothetical protein